MFPSQKNIFGLKFGFIDSYRFIDRILAVMVSNLPDSKSPLIHLVKRKCVYPYEFVDFIKMSFKLDKKPFHNNKKGY